MVGEYLGDPGLGIPDEDGVRFQGVVARAISAPVAP
jgi:hypothetical protein